MTSKLLLATLLLWSGSVVAQNQLQTNDTLSKYNADLAILMKKYHRESTTNKKHLRTLKVGGQSHDLKQGARLIVTCTDAQSLSAYLTQKGYTHTVISNTCITARVPVADIDSLSRRPEVKLLSLSRRHYLKMDKARPASNVSKVHKGTNLETPFTGKGVILGVIDQGFEYRHAAFNDAAGKTRVRSVWDRRTNKQPTSNLPTRGEKDGSHATHVTAIAAGREVNNNNLQGVAPDAEIIMIPSTFMEDEVVEDVKYVKDFAEKENKPWVVNMSFGSQFGPHDGTTAYNQALDKLTGKGGIITAANGNEGDMTIHGMATLHPGEARYVIFEETVLGDTRDDADIIFALWNQTNDGKSHLKFTKMLLVDDKEVVPDEKFWEKADQSESAQFWEQIDSENGKQSFVGVVKCVDFEEEFKKHYTQYKNDKLVEVLPALKIELLPNETTPQTFHLWTEPHHGIISSKATFDGKESEMLRGDNQYLVAEGSSSVPSAISVGSYNSRSGWRSKIAKYTVPEQPGVTVGAVSSFSSLGPFLGDELKPTISAPGCYIISAYNSADAEVKTLLQDQAVELVEMQTVNRKKYYYGVMQGTSMASPYVAGVVCLWLEANPNLDPKTIKEVLKNTAKRDALVGKEEWTPSRGYGKIDAYEGLKEVLRLKTATGVERVANSTAPITLQPELDHWKILFNNAERYAHLRVFAADGRLVQQQRWERVQQGQEQVLSLETLPAGTYLVNISTAAANITRRVLVK